MPEPGTIIGVILVGLIAAAAARLYLRDARAYRAGRGDERYAWLRRSHPNHATLPPAPPKVLLRDLPQRWGWGTVAVCAGQAGAICGLNWMLFLAASDEVPAERYKIVTYGFLALVILVAFGTAVLTRLWDISRAGLARRRAGACQRQEPVGEDEGVLAPRGRLREGA